MNFSWQNVIDGNGIGITLTGMLIVFSGLLLISLFIAALPRVLALMDDKCSAADKAQTAESVASGSDDPTEDEIMAVISLVLHLETERSLGEGSRMTISRKKRGSIWASAGKMRSLSEGGSHA